jgi:hypothetical protein
MRSKLSTSPLSVALSALFLLLAASSWSWAQDRFALAVGPHGDLVVFGPHGEKAGTYTLPTIGQAVTINGGPSFQISYGRDVNDRLSVILSPDSAHPQDLHFSVLNKTIDADKLAVVTLTFSSNLNSVKVDPGYVGVVQVNSQSVHHEAVAHQEPMRKQPAPAASETASSSTTTFSTTASSSTASTSAPSLRTSPAPRMNTELAPRDLPPASGQPGTGGSAVLTPVTGTPSEEVSTNLSKKRLFWAEPVTSPNAKLPHVGSDEMKLVAVHGSVSVRRPDGTTERGINGTLVPSGSHVVTTAGSSAAVLMGGVDSARLLPNSNVAVVQNMEGTVRHTTVDLESGTVFSRVGRRPGETQKYEVRTPQGVAAARGTEYADTLRNHIHFVFVNKGTVDLFVGGKLVGTVTGVNGTIGKDAMGEPRPSQEEMDRVLNEVLEELQPFNVTTIQALFDYESGHATPEEIALLRSELYGSLVVDDDVPYYNPALGAGMPVALHDLFLPQDVFPFKTHADEPTSSAESSF